MASFNLAFVVLFSFLLLVFGSHAQNVSETTIINRKVEVVEYEYTPVYWGLQTSASFGLFYPFVINKGESGKQQYFENGRNVRPGFMFGIEQTLNVENWAITAGIAYQQYNENFSYFEYKTENIVIQDAAGNIKQVQLALGDPVLFSRDNYLGYMVSPIKIAYYPDLFQKKVRFLLQGDFKYLLRTDYKGKFSLSEPLITVEGFNRYLYAVNMAFAYRFRLAKNLSVLIEPLYSFSLNDQIKRSDFSFKVDYVCLNIYLSVNY
jgi:hypothetical protein